MSPEQPVDWVQGRRLAELTGLTVKALDRKRQRGVWREGFHYIKVGDEIRYSISAFNAWVEGVAVPFSLSQKDYFSLKEARIFTGLSKDEFRAMAETTGLSSAQFMGVRIFRRPDVQNALDAWKAGASGDFKAQQELLERRLNSPTCLYRHFDADSRLLYVGISMSLSTRTGQHSVKPWFMDVRTITVEWLPNRPAALVAEREAIRAEKPLHNVMGTE